MITLKKLSMKVAGGVLVGMLAMGSAQASVPFAPVLPEISTLTAEVGARIAHELKAMLAEAVKKPRPARTLQTASVIVSEGFETVVVTASRLPTTEKLANAGKIEHVVQTRF